MPSCECKTHAGAYNICQRELSAMTDDSEILFSVCAYMERDYMGDLGDSGLTKILVLCEDGTLREPTDDEHVAAEEAFNDVVGDWYEEERRDALVAAAEDEADSRAFWNDCY
jgi:hypothetical protein